MLKIRCACGDVIVDVSDFLPDKARLIADQDWEDVLYPDGNAALEEVQDRAWDLSRSMWQCRACGRLYLDDRDGGLHRFDPVDPSTPNDLLRSAHREKWKGSLRGSWRAGENDRPPGELWWSCGVSEEGYERFATREDLARRYHEVFQRLWEANLLRSAFLRDSDVMLHQWPRAE